MGEEFEMIVNAEGNDAGLYPVIVFNVYEVISQGENKTKKLKIKMGNVLDEPHNNIISIG